MFTIPRLYLISFLLAVLTMPALSQKTSTRWPDIIVNPEKRIHDSVMAVRVPLLEYPPSLLQRALPSKVDNSTNEYWPGIFNQEYFYSCQQFAGVAYTFGYEINRMRNLTGWFWEHRYPTHYTWNFMNNGDRLTGVNFLESFEMIRQQGHMTHDDYGVDTATIYLGWLSGYDKYYRGMPNRIRKVNAIEVNNTEGILALKNYLYDHLDGSPVGGVVCFTTSSLSIYNMPVIPPGLYEEGKHIVLSWESAPNHGLTVVGYDDGVGYDVNGDGGITTELDITGDGIVDARDWEKGAFKIANSYGTGYWGDTGYCYALYRSFAMNYEEGGVWNNRVYTVSADTGYHPKLTMKVRLDYNYRKRIRVLAGVSGDDAKQVPSVVQDFPMFNFQGGEHVMQGWDQDPAAREIEFGLDVTDLLNSVPAGQPAKFFLGVEERDPEQIGEGKIVKASFIDYQNGIHEYPVNDSNVIIIDNGITFVSAVIPVNKPAVNIITEHLPPANPPQPVQVQLAAEGGTPPYTWSLRERYSSAPIPCNPPAISGFSLVHSNAIAPFTAVPLPFTFSFYGKNYDTVYINYNGYITFEPLYLPGEYTTNAISMLKMLPCISPAFSLNYRYQVSRNEGIFVDSDASRMIIRWKASSTNYPLATNDFSVILYKDGSFDMIYGTMDNPGYYMTCYPGLSRGDGLESDLRCVWDANTLGMTASRYVPPVLPSGITLSESGLLSVSQCDSSLIYELEVEASDAGRIRASKKLVLSAGLEITATVKETGNDAIFYEGSHHLATVLSNTGTQPIQGLTLKLESADTLLQITDSIVTIGTLQPSQHITVPDAFAFNLGSVADDGLPVMVRIKATAGEKQWIRQCRLHVSASRVELSEPWVKDGFNDLLEPGEVADLIIRLTNKGTRAAKNIDIQLESGDTALVIQSDHKFQTDSIPSLSVMEYQFRVKASRWMPWGTKIPMHFLVKETNRNQQELDFMLPVGRKVALADLTNQKMSQNAMKEALDSLKVAYEIFNMLPFGYDEYSCIFLCLGEESTGNHSLTNAEAGTLVPYLQRKGNLYMESYVTWYYQSVTPLHPWFKYTTSKVTSYNYLEIGGVPGTWTDGMSFMYTSPMNHAIFNFSPVEPAYATLADTTVAERNFEIVYDGEDYKTIGTFLGFYGLADNGHPSTKVNLMRQYLDFFGLNFTGPYPFFHASSTEVVTGKNVEFTDDSFDNIVSRSWEFPGGEPAASTETNPVVVYNTAGRYDVKLTVSDGVRSKSILKSKYIDVEWNTGYNEQHAETSFRIYPVPAHDRLVIMPENLTDDHYDLVLYDLAGNKRMEERNIKALPGSGYQINTSGLRGGMYILSIRLRDSVFRTKVVIR